MSASAVVGWTTRFTFQQRGVAQGGRAALVKALQAREGGRQGMGRLYDRPFPGTTFHETGQPFAAEHVTMWLILILTIWQTYIGQARSQTLLLGRIIGRTQVGESEAERQRAGIALIQRTDPAYDIKAGSDETSLCAAPVVTSIAATGTVQILAKSRAPDTEVATAVVDTSLAGFGHISTPPIITDSVPKPRSLLSAFATSIPAPTTSYSDLVTPRKNKMAAEGQNIFAEPIAKDPPPANIPKKTDHPAPRIGITSAPPIGTNKFYTNFFLGSQTSPSYLFPYAVAWGKGKGAAASWGLSVSHVEAKQRVYGQVDPHTGAAAYFINPVGIQSVCLSAKELGANTALTSDLLTAFSARISLRPSSTGAPVVQFPLVQGAAFVTALYNGGTPLIQTGVFFKTVTRSTQQTKAGVIKYKLLLEDGATWLLYAYHTRGDPLDLQVINNGLARSKGSFFGSIQVAKDPGNGEAIYDRACGVYATGLDLSGSTSHARGSYTFKFAKGGMSATTLLIYALPHHQTSFDDATRCQMTQLKLQTTTKGLATAVHSDSWTLLEGALPVNMGFVPWSPRVGSISALSNTASTFIRNISQQEISQNMLQQTNLNSMYFSGKALAKFAKILVTISLMLGDQVLAQNGLNQLKVAFARFAENKQEYPLVYDSAWGGLVSSASYVTGNPGADFGNSYYNDHHFHYGYFIYTAAVIGRLDPSWVPANKAFVNTLVRDIANPSTQDGFFPTWRCFDWYAGHSWAHGLFETLDGKDQESSSEDTMHAYAMKMWGTVSGDANMEARGNLMLAIQARSMQAYYLYTCTNTVQPPGFIGNKVAGILFENKIDHTTFFGNDIEFIQGIHMLPLLPHTPLIRTPEFVAEEWNTYFNNGRADKAVGGWKGILFANYATIDPRGAYAFFSSRDFDPSWLDGGASLSWYLAYSAALGGL